MAALRSSAPVRHRRVCIACGTTFVPFDTGQRNFCCGDCSWAHDQASVMGTIDRMMRVGDRVVVLLDGRAGTLIRVPDAEHAVVEIGDALVSVGLGDVEKVQSLKVRHTCGKGRNPFAVAKKGANDGGENEDAGSVSGSEAARGSDS